MKTFGYPKIEKLKSKKLIELLFIEGEWQSCGPLKIRTLSFTIEASKDALTGTHYGVSVSKRFFKKAVDRNRIKRLLREVYRLNKSTFHESFGQNSVSMIFWNSSKMPASYKEVEGCFLSICRAKKDKFELKNISSNLKTKT